MEDIAFGDDNLSDGPDLDLLVSIDPETEPAEVGDVVVGEFDPEIDPLLVISKIATDPKEGRVDAEEEGLEEEEEEEVEGVEEEEDSFLLDDYGDSYE